MLKKEGYLKTVRRPYPPLFCSLVCMGYSEGKYFRNILKNPFRVRNMAHVDDVWYYGKAELKKGGQLALESWRDKKMFNYTKKEFKRREDNLIKAAKRSFEEFCRAYQEYMPALILIFAIDNFIEKALRDTLLKKLPVKKVDDLMDQLNIPLQDNFYKQEEYDLATSSNLSDHVNKYKWLHARYGEDREYTKEEAKKKLRNINKEKFLRNWKEQKKKLRKTILYAKKLLIKNAYLVDIFQYVIYYRTHRTDIMNKSGFLAIPMLKNKAKSLGVTYGQLLVCSGEEVLKKNVPSKDILISRIKDACILLEDKRVKCSTEKDSKKLIQFFEESVKEGTDEFKGKIACKGYIRGEAKIVFNKDDFKKIKNDDILVASMTTPEMVAIMKKAAGFITDEGGITCHASIVSRELNKPCIIGTKIATKVLKDGDLVEVDAEKGIVRIIKRG